MKFYFGLVSAALIFAAVSGGSLLWDGSYYMYRIVDTHIPFERFPGSLTLILALPVLLATDLTNQIPVLQAVFGLTYALIPILSLALSWWIVRREAPALFIWPALGIGIGTLMLQLHFVAEPILAIQLFWPLAMAILTRSRRLVYLVVIVLSLAILFAHPLSVLLFGLAAIMALAVGWRDPVDRTQKGLMAIGMVGLAVAATIKYWPLQARFETEAITPAGVQSSFGLSMPGLPTFAFLGIYTVAVIIFIGPLLRRNVSSWWRLFLYALEFAGLVAIGALFSLWASDVRWWENAITFRAASLFISLPFIGAAVLESLIHGPAWFASPEGDWGHRIKTTQIVGIIFAIVLVQQSISWIGLTNQLRETIAQSSTACISSSAIPKSARTPLGHWTATSYSLLLQGMTPEKVILADDGCSKTDFSRGLPIADWDLRKWQGGEFDLHLLSNQLAGTRGAP